MTQLRPMFCFVVDHQACAPPLMGVDLPRTPGSDHDPLKYFFHLPGAGSEMGARANVLLKLIDVFRAFEKRFRIKNPEYVVFTCRFSAAEEPIKLGFLFDRWATRLDRA